MQSLTDFNCSTFFSVSDAYLKLLIIPRCQNHWLGDRWGAGCQQFPRQGNKHSAVLFSSPGLEKSARSMSLVCLMGFLITWPNVLGTVVWSSQFISFLCFRLLIKRQNSHLSDGRCLGCLKWFSFRGSQILYRQKEWKFSSFFSKNTERWTQITLHQLYSVLPLLSGTWGLQVHLKGLFWKPC